MKEMKKRTKKRKRSIARPKTVRLKTARTKMITTHFRMLMKSSKSRKSQASVSSSLTKNLPARIRISLTKTPAEMSKKKSKTVRSMMGTEYRLESSRMKTKSI